MPESISLRLPLLVAEQAQKPVTHNEALRALDALVQLSVKDRDLATPPGSPVEGDRYIVAASPTGVWSGHAADIAVWQDSAWDFHDPHEGWRCWVDDENVFLIFNGSAWVDWGAALGALQNLALLGIGTIADATNPFSAKLNKALWTAKYAAEGGDGDLRYTMNKETTSDTVSLLLQKAFSGRAEIGLIGDDNLTVKVSPDGSSWVTALVIDKTTGYVGLGTNSPLGRLELSGSTFAQSHLKSHHTGVTTAAGGGGIVLHHNNAAGALPNSADRLGFFSFGTTDGATSRNGGGVFGYADGAWSSSSLPTRFTFETAPAGSTTRAERMRIDSSGNIQVAGTNTVIDANRIFRLRSYTIATLPAASTAAGQMIYCSDLGGGGDQLNSDGTNWRRVSRGGQQAIATDAAFTLTTLTSAEEQKHTGTLTADRALTLSTTNAYAGARFRLTRTGGGAFNITHALKNLATNTWAEFVYDGAAWYLAEYGAL